MSRSANLPIQKSFKYFDHFSQGVWLILKNEVLQWEIFWIYHGHICVSLSYEAKNIIYLPDPL